MSLNLGPFVEELWQSVAATYKATLRLPFNQGLISGQLPHSQFLFYINQDVLYLGAIADIFVTVATKAPDPTSAKLLIEIREIILKERDHLRDAYLNTMSFDAVSLRMEPACYNYTQFLLKISQEKPYPVVVAALLACPLVFFKISQVLLKEIQMPNPYASRIESYQDASLIASVQCSCDLTERAYAPKFKKSMKQAFQRAAELEYYFWAAEPAEAELLEV